MTGHFWVHLNIFVSWKRASQNCMFWYDKRCNFIIMQSTNSIINSDRFPMMSRWKRLQKAVAGGDSCSIYNWNWLLGRSLVSHIYLLSPFGKKKSKKVGGYSSNSGIMNDTTYWHRQALSAKNFCLRENLFYHSVTWLELHFCTIGCNFYMQCRTIDPFPSSNTMANSIEFLL